MRYVCHGCKPNNPCTLEPGDEGCIITTERPAEECNSGQCEWTPALVEINCRECGSHLVSVPAKDEPTKLHIEPCGVCAARTLLEGFDRARAILEGGRR